MPLKPPFDPKLIVSDEEALQEWEPLGFFKPGDRPVWIMVVVVGGSCCRSRSSSGSGGSSSLQLLRLFDAQPLPSLGLRLASRTSSKTCQCGLCFSSPACESRLASLALSPEWLMPVSQRGWLALPCACDGAFPACVRLRQDPLVSRGKQLGELQSGVKCEVCFCCLAED